MSSNDATHTDTSSSTVLLVSDAKHRISTDYPKLNSRFNFAFHGYNDNTPLREAIDGITSDVLAWLKSMPENFKTSNHALSRPKYGLIFVLKAEEIRKHLGEMYCDNAIELIEGQWDNCKKDIVVAKEGVPDETEEELRAKLDDVKSKNDFLVTAMTNLISIKYDREIAALFEALLVITKF